MTNFTRKDLIKFNYINWNKLNTIMIKIKKNMWKYIETAPNNIIKGMVIVRVNDKKIYQIMESEDIAYTKID